jgi:MerR family mercuric resistance operon transcriptional regulator
MSFTIGELSRRTGVNVETIRYYERLGLLGSVSRSETGRRLFDMPELETLRFIRRCRDMLFSIETIRLLLPLRAKGPCSEVKAIAAAHLSELRIKLNALASLEKKLTFAVSQCPGDDSARCSILALLNSPERSTAAAPLL